MDPITDYYIEFVRHLEEVYAERLARTDGLLERLSLRSLVCWAARRLHKIPTEVISEFYGYESEACVRETVYRFQRRVSRDPGLENALRSVDIHVSRFCQQTTHPSGP